MPVTHGTYISMSICAWSKDEPNGLCISSSIAFTTIFMKFFLLLTVRCTFITQMVSEHSLCQDITIHDDEEKNHQKMLKYMAKCYLLYQVSVVRYFAHLIRVFLLLKIQMVILQWIQPSQAVDNSQIGISPDESVNTPTNPHILGQHRLNDIW